MRHLPRVHPRRRKASGTGRGRRATSEGSTNDKGSSASSCSDGAGCASATQAFQAAGNYQAFRLQTGTALHETDSRFAFLLADNRDLYAIKKRDTGSGRTEVHVLSAVSNYQRFTLQTATGLHETGADFEFALSPARNLVAIKKSNTGSGSTEVHILSAASNYQTFIVQTGTALHETGDDFEFEVANNNDLYAIKKSGTGSGSTELHVLSAASNYQRFSRQTATGLHETDQSFSFLLSRTNDLYAIKKSGTGSGSTEVHVLSASSQYRSFALQTGTVLHETGSDFDFALSTSFDLFAIKKFGTGAGATEVHVLAR